MPRFVVAYSGGLDSTVLLHVAAAFFGPEAVLAVHVNHHLQESAALFEAQARETCRAWGIALRVCHLKGKPARGESLEAWARQQRYRALNQVAKEQGIGIVMTAHHQDDQVETLLIALSRGAGLEGLSGIASERDLMPLMPGVQLHRPLLDCSRDDLQEYARLHGLGWVEDPSNRDHHYLRNHIRAELLPVLRRVLPGFTRQASRSMAHIAAAASASAECRKAAGTDQKGLLRLADLRTQDDTGKALMLRHWLRGNGVRAPSQARLNEMLSQLLGGGPSLRMVLSEATVRKEQGLCWIERQGQGEARAAKAARHSVPASAPLPSPDALQATARGWTWHLPAFKGLLLVERRPGRAQPRPDEESALRALHVSRASSQQKMLLDETRPRRTLKNLFQEAGIPAALRPRLPCVLSGDEVLFVAGLGNAAKSPWLFHFLPDL